MSHGWLKQVIVTPIWFRLFFFQLSQFV